VIMGSLGLLAGLGLAVAARFLAVEVDPVQERILEALPGANCGGCGFAGCADFAGAVARGEAPPDGCPVAGPEGARVVAKIAGVPYEEKARKVALVFCQGTRQVAAHRFRYNGLASCASAQMIEGGDKQCSYGCLGLGDCQHACPFGAIEIIHGDIARVIPERCTGCGKCIEACPRHIIRLVPADATIHVLCNNTDKGGVARKACAVACIGCKKCQKFLGDESIVVQDYLARIDYENPPEDIRVIDECPTGAIREIIMSQTITPEGDEENEVPGGRSSARTQGDGSSARGRDASASTVRGAA